MAKDSSNLVRPQKREDLNMRPRLFLIDRVSNWSRWSRCVNDIDCWMVNNGLKLNQDKTELVLISSKFRCRPSLEFIQVVDEKIQPNFPPKIWGWL